MPYVGDIHKHKKFHIQEYVEESFTLEINYKRYEKLEICMMFCAVCL